MQRTTKLIVPNSTEALMSARLCSQRRFSVKSKSQSRTSWDALPLNIQQNATLFEHARRHNYQIPPLSKSQPDLDQGTGYQIAAAIRILRERMNDETAAGRKIGFTNRGIWPEYGIDASNWSYIYRSTILDLTQFSGAQPGDAVELNISHLAGMEPRIEPEIILGLARVPSSAMNDHDILECIEWIAHGFEIVTSIFPNWKFTAADTTAAFALHGLLAVGPKFHIKSQSLPMEQLLNQLADFKISLSRNGEVADEGKGSNVLGSPVKALRHLVELLEVDEYNEPLSVGETVTTGTLTRALPITDGDVWSTELTGIDLTGLKVKFQFH